jgi:hypothetical protein
MNKSAALLKLLEALNHVGLDSERIQVVENGPELEVEFHLVEQATIKVTITDFWRYPTLACYFVNFSHTNGDFMACMGTPHVERAIFDLGQAIHAANAATRRKVT